MVKGFAALYHAGRGISILPTLRVASMMAADLASGSSRGRRGRSCRSSRHMYVAVG